MGKNQQDFSGNPRRYVRHFIPTCSPNDDFEHEAGFGHGVLFNFHRMAPLYANGLQHKKALGLLGHINRYYIVFRGHNIYDQNSCLIPYER